MRNSLIKFNLISRSFANEIRSKTNKYKKLSEKIEIPMQTLPKDLNPEEKFGIDKVAPKPGEIYPLPVPNSKLIALEEGYYDAFKRDPVSSYYSIKVKDKLFHVFNAARYPLGRMCSKIAFIIQGKSSPHYKPNLVEFKDKCIILNAKYAYLTGKKLTQKYYKYHTGYPGGLKSIRTKDYLERNPKEMILTSIKGMLPKNKMRPDYLSKVEIIPEGGHDYIKLGLPQFGKMHPLDYNEIFGFKNMNPENTVITHSTYEQNNIPERFKNFKHVYDETLTKPRYMITPKISEDDRKTMKYEKYASRDRFMQYRNIRNKGYRFI